MDAQCRIELLGCLRAEQAGRSITRFQTQKTGGLLAYLAYYRHRPHPREELVELLWPEDDPESARHKLRMALSSLRRQLEPPGVPAGTVIVANRFMVQLNPAVVTTDVTDFETALQAAARTERDLERTEVLSRAVALYRGELLPGYYEEWILLERRRLAEVYSQRLEHLVQLLQKTGNLHRAIEVAHQAVAADPLREEAHELLARLLEANGQPEAALRQYLELERLLDEEPDAKPSPGARKPGRGRDQEKSFRRVPRRIGQGEEPSPARSQDSPDLPFQPGVDEPPTIPAGTVAFLLAEIADGALAPSGSRGMTEASIKECQRLLRSAVRAHGGHELKGTARAVHAVFGRVTDALKAALSGQQAVASLLKTEAVPESGIRMALHTGEIAPGELFHASTVFSHSQSLLMAAHPGQFILCEKSAGLLSGTAIPDVRLVDLGRYRVADHGAPERLFQAISTGAEEVVVLRPNARPGVVSNIPRQFSLFLGRQREVEQLQALLLDDRSALVTITGPGGQGKTRLAIEVGAALESALQGAVWFVPLADLQEASLIPEAIQRALNLQPSSSVDPLDQVAEALAGQKALLILDNFEHLAAHGASIVPALLERVAMLSILTTSRQLLAVAGEQEFSLAPLQVPSGKEQPRQLLQYAGVQLFVDRAQQVRADFQITKGNAAAVAELCRRLEGLPLAIELAAARSGALSPGQMLARLDQRFELLTSRQRDAVDRHRTMRAAIGWSYDLLAPPVREFFSRLSVFRGGWSLEAAEVVCEEPRALEYLGQLRESSLIQSENEGPEVRFRMLDSIREYAGEQLSGEEQASLERRHAAFYLGLAEQAEPQYAGPEQATWLDRLESERANLQAVLVGALREGGDPELGLRLAAALWRFWYVRGHWIEGREQLAAFLLRGPTARTTVRAKALHGAGVLAHYQGDLAKARLLLEESLVICRELYDRRSVAAVLCSLGFVARATGDRAGAQALFEEGLRSYQEVGDRHGIALSLAGLGDIALCEGRSAVARSFYTESLAIRRQLGDKRSLASGLNNLADALRMMEELHSARALYQEGLTLMREVGSKGGTAWSLAGLGHVALGLGELRTARALFEEGLRIRQSLGDRHGMAECLEGLAAVAGGYGETEQAARLFGAAEAVREGVPVSLEVSTDPDDDAEADAPVPELPSDGFLRAWAEGRNLSSARAIEYALAEAIRPR